MMDQELKTPDTQPPSYASTGVRTHASGVAFILIAACLVALSVRPLFAAPPGSMTELGDIPTADIIDYGSYESNFRFLSAGGLLTKLNFGVFSRLNIGFSLDVEEFIGTEDIDIQEPEIQIKFRLFDGGPSLPALAVGFDSQGYRFNKLTENYLDDERGLYFVLSQEIIWPGFAYHGGIAISNFESDKVFGFVGLHLDIQERLALFTEYDNIREFADNRFNAGFRVFVTEYFHIDFSVRDIGSGETVDGFKRTNERIIKLRYIGAF